MEGLDRSTIAGLVLIILGGILLVLQWFEGLGDSIVLFIIGGLFLLGYFSNRAYGLLIPGAILIGIGLGEVGGGALTSIESVDTIGLGLGFLSIYVIDRAYQGSTHWWPLIPGGLLLLSGIASINQSFESWMEFGWPLIMIAGGLYLLFAIGRSKGQSADHG